jgi:hypothetical protein
MILLSSRFGLEVVEGSNMFRSILRVAAILLVLVINGFMLCAAAQSPAPSITPQMKELIDAHRAVMVRMNTPDAGGKLRPLDDAQIRPALAQGWKLAGEWAGAWFDLHPEPSAKDLDNLYVDFTPPPRDPDVYDPNLPNLYAMAGSATRIATNVYVVRAAYEESQSANATSTFFVVSRDANGRYLPMWSIKPLAERHYRKRDEIGLWAFLDSCAYYCGPPVVQEVIPLPPSEKGQPRFAIDAFQATNGNTLMKQLSVWQWNGAEAENLVVRSYKLYIDEDRAIQLVGDLLSVPTKEETRSFSSYGCCAEPRGMWILRINPDKVRDLGHRFLQPQIQWADRLLASIGPRSSVAEGLASPSVIAYLRHTRFDADSIDECHVLSSGKKGAFEISFGVGTKLWFAYELRNGQPYFTRIRVE